MQLIIVRQTGTIARRGDILEVRATGTPWGGHETNIFVKVDIPEPMSALAQYGNKRWTKNLIWSVVSADVPNDTYVLRIENSANNTLGDGNLTRPMLEKFLADWNITVNSATQNSVDIDVNILEVLKSNEFWNTVMNNVIVTELDYNSVTGVHLIQFDYSALQKNPTAVESRAVEVGGVVISHVNSVLTAEFTRDDVREKFFSEVKKKVQRDAHVARYRYYVSDAVVTFLENQGGSYSTDLQTALGYINDKAND